MATQLFPGTQNPTTNQTPNRLSARLPQICTFQRWLTVAVHFLMANTPARLLWDLQLVRRIRTFRRSQLIAWGWIIEESQKRICIIKSQKTLEILSMKL